MSNNKKFILGLIGGIILMLGAFALGSLSGRQQKEFGGTTTRVVGGDLSVTGGLSVTGSATTTGNQVVSGNLSIGGTSAFTGTSTFSGTLLGVGTMLYSSMNSAATTTACTFLNSSGGTRVVRGSFVVDRGTASSIGSVSWQSGTSTGSGANGSSAIAFTKDINATITRLNGSDAITTTSTAQTAYYIWRSGENFNFISSTTTNAGTCYISF